eukprot:4748036-Lingulodinium_polyedra.AAC.1
MATEGSGAAPVAVSVAAATATSSTPSSQGKGADPFTRRDLWASYTHVDPWVGLTPHAVANILNP